MEVEEFNRLNELEYGEGLTPETPEVIAAAIHSGQPAAQRTPASQAAQTAAQRTGETSRKLLLFTFIGSGCCALPAIILVIEVFASHSWSATEGRINSEVNPLRMLAISTVITFVTTKTISITVYLLAFFVAAKWLIASHRNHPTAERPTPSQYSALQSLLQGPSILTALKANFRRGGNGRQPPPPAILKRVAIIVTALLILSFIVPAVDTWLHATTVPVAYISYGDYPADQPSNYGRSINVQRCIAQPTGDTAAYATCGLLGPNQQNTLQAGVLGLRTLGNGSADTLVGFTDDQTAILAPRFPVDTKFGTGVRTMQTVTYTADTYGVRCTCQSITSQCTRQPSNVISTGMDIAYSISCSGLPSVRLDLLLGPQDAQFGILDTGNETLQIDQPFNAIKSNPFPLVGLIRSGAYVGELNTFVNDTGFFYDGQSAWNVLYCNVSTLEVNYLFNNTYDANTVPVYTSISTKPAAIGFSNMTGAMIASGLIGPYVAMQVEGVGLRTGDYAESFALYLSKALMGFSALIYQPIEASFISEIAVGESASISSAALATYLGLIAVYVIVTLVIGSMAYATCRNLPWADLAQLRLVSSLPTVQAAFVSGAPERTWSLETEDMFSETSTVDQRLGMGEIRGADGGIAFGVAKRLIGE